MLIRPYQQEMIDGTFAAWKDHRCALTICATGGGKTIVSSEIMRQGAGRALFLADATELVSQNADKYHKHTGEFPGVEMASLKAKLSDRVVIASAQSISRRLDKYPPAHFDQIICDEAHRNSLGGMSQKVLNHFSSAKVCGMTATPMRSDKKNLGDFYTTIAADIGLERLIREGWLTRITLKTLPLGISLKSVKTGSDGDYKLGELGEVVEPHLLEAAKLIVKHAPGRKTVVFVPLVSTAYKFAAACRAAGLRAVAVDGDEKGALTEFTHGDAEVIVNAALLTTGWDCDLVDCIMILRPTKSEALFRQMVGRGTRPRYADGFNPNLDHSDVAGRLDALKRGPKPNLLLLDPLFMTDDVKLISAARLMGRDADEVAALEKMLKAEALEQGDLFDREAVEVDLLDAGEKVESEVVEMRERALKKKLAEASKKKAKTVDAVEFFLSIQAKETAEYIPESPWEAEPITAAQRTALERNGFDPDQITCRGQATALMDLIYTRREAGLASPKQVKYLRQFGHPSPDLVTFAEAGKFLDSAFARGTASVVTQSVDPSTPRKWRSVVGNVVEGAFVRLTASGAELRLVTGRALAVPLERFIESDRRIIIQLAQAQQVAAATIATI